MMVKFHGHLIRAPLWAEYLAADDMGTVWAFAQKPEILIGGGICIWAVMDGPYEPVGMVSDAMVVQFWDFSLVACGRVFQGEYRELPAMVALQMYELENNEN